MSGSKKYNQNLIAQGCTTYSKRKDQYIEGVYPEYYRDFKGRDFVCGLGSNLKGWRNNYALPSRLEPLLAAKLHKLFPFMESMKFLKTGSAACEAAVRIARAYRQNKLAKNKKYGIGAHYHGCSNWCIAQERPGSGTFDEGYTKVPDLKNIIEAIKKEPGIYAYCIIEPVMLDMNVKAELLELRRLCTKHDICLIFDEIVTGFRVPKYCIANYFGITPDLICLGKALGNGYPIAVVGGARRYMETPGYFISNTHNGEESGLKASLETLKWLTPAKPESLWKRGARFQEVMNFVLETIGVELYGIPTRGTWRGDEKNKALFWQEMSKRGYLFGKAFFMNFAHTPAILKQTLKDAATVVRDIRDGKVKLEGQLPREAFSRFR